MIEKTGLQDLKKEILERIKGAAQKSDIESITCLGKAAEKCESLINEVLKLENRIKEFSASISSPLGLKKKQNRVITEKIDSNIATYRLSPKREGANIRNEWVKNIQSQGVKLNGHGKRFQTESAKYVGVASANELDRSQQLLNKWFLGVKDERMDIVVLLCRDLEKKVHDIILPVSEIGAAWEALSRSGGQVKFNVRRQRGEFTLLIPRNEPLEVTKYIGNYKPLGIGQPAN